MFMVVQPAYCTWMYGPLDYIVFVYRTLRPESLYVVQIILYLMYEYVQGTTALPTLKTNKIQ